MSMLVPARGKCLPKGKASSEMAKVNSLNGDQHARTIGNQAVAHKVIIVRGIIHGDSQVDVQYVVLQDILPPSVLVRSSPRRRMLTGMSHSVLGKNPNGKMINARSRSMRRPKVRKVREKDPSLKANPRGRPHQGLSLHDRHSLHRRSMSDPNPSLNQKHVPV